MSKNNQSVFEFSYAGDNFIDLNTLITSQFHFLATFNELQKELYPDASVKIKVGAFKEGSFILELLSETTWLENLFNQDNVEVAGKVLGGFASLLAIRKALKGKKAEKVEGKNGNVEVTIGNGNKITVNNAVFNIYQNSSIVNKAIEKNFELLNNDTEIEGIKITEVKGKTKKDILNIGRDSFEDISKSNEYLDKSQTENTLYNERVFIKKPNLFPQKNRVWIWEFIHRGRDIKAKITDNKFLKDINNGLRVGQGDRLIVDLVVYYKFDKRFNTWIESNRFDIIKIHSLEERTEETQVKLI
ncbi:hypothetical protein [Lutibacter sp.]|uniref:hypothetical protein n=1 Tax=Lutibacter sp. TaxID=1925666 RepID=UPI003567DFAF